MISQQQGFTLIEALISVAIMAIGFAGVYTLVGISDRILQNSIDKETLNFQANEIIETLHSDQSNLAEYSGKSLSSCTSLKASKGKDTQLKRMKRWCERAKGEVGDKRNHDRRKIHVEKKTIGGKDFNIVAVELSNKDGKNSIWVKRVFNAY